MPVLFTVNIKCDNSAFCDEVGTSERSAAPELARILRDIARRKLKELLRENPNHTVWTSEFDEAPYVADCLVEDKQ